MTLGEYLEQGGAQRRTAGVWDCCTFPADWAMLCGHPDPMAKWRGTYDTEENAELLIAEAAGRAEFTGRGGLEALFFEGMWEAGIPEVDIGPQLAPGAPVEGLVAGDIAVLNIGGAEAGGIFTGRRWAFVPDRGLGFVSLDRDCLARVWRPVRG